MDELKLKQWQVIETSEHIEGRFTINKRERKKGKNKREERVKMDTQKEGNERGFRQREDIIRNQMEKEKRKKD